MGRKARSGITTDFPDCVQTSPHVAYGGKETYGGKERMVKLSNGWSYLSVNRVNCENWWKMQIQSLPPWSSSFCSFTLTLNPLDLTLQTCFLNLLTPSTIVQISCAPRLVSGWESVQPMPNPSPRPSLRPSKGRALGPYLTQRGDSSLWAPWGFTETFSEDLTWYNMYVSNRAWRLPE